MSVFIDSNVLLRSAQPSQPMHERAIRNVASLIEREESLVVTPQIVAEFWNAATRPVDQDGLGLSHEQTREELGAWRVFSPC